MELIDLIKKNIKQKTDLNTIKIKSPSFIKIPIIKEEEMTLIRSHSSIGDAVMILGGIQELYSMGIKVFLKIHENSQVIFKNHPAVYKIQSLYSQIETSTVINLSNPCPAALYEVDNPQIKLNRIDIFAHSMGILNPSRPQIFLEDSEIDWGFKWIEKQFGEVGNIVGIVHKCASDGMFRNYPYMKEVSKQLIRRKIKVLYIDPNYSPFVFLGKKNFSSTIGLSLRELISIMPYLRFLVTSDTGPLHLAGALNIPIVAIFGPTDGKVRCDHYSNVDLITSECENMPCWYNYCHKDMMKSSPCLSKIKSGEVCDRILNLLEKRNL